MTYKHVDAAYKKSTLTNAPALAVLAFVAHRTNNDGIANLYQQEIVDSCRLGRRTVQRAIAAAIAAGELEIIAGGQGRSRATTYRFLIPAGDAKGVTLTHLDNVKGVRESIKGVRESIKGVRESIKGVTLTHKKKEEEERIEEGLLIPPLWKKYLDAEKCRLPQTQQELDNLLHPAVIAWINSTGHWPSYENFPLIIGTLGDDPNRPALEKAWERWIGSGYNRRNIAGVLEWSQHLSADPNWRPGKRASAQQPAGFTPANTYTIWSES